jgi:hypothetical protein
MLNKKKKKLFVFAVFPSLVDHPHVVAGDGGGLPYMIAVSKFGRTVADNELGRKMAAVSEVGRWPVVELYKLVVINPYPHAGAVSKSHYCICRYRKRL